LPEFCGRQFAAAQTRRDLKSIERVEVFTEPGATANPEFGLCAPSLWTLKEGSNSGGRPDFFDRNRRPHPKSMDWKSGVSSPHRARAKATHGVRAVNVATKPNGPGTTICRGRQPWGGFLPAGVWGALAGSVESTRQNHAGSFRLWHVLCRRMAVKPTGRTLRQIMV
jgi:hypothetical protein